MKSLCDFMKRGCAASVGATTHDLVLAAAVHENDAPKPG
jgi:hypothetical protein